ncbi:RNA polymerase sigma factor [Sphingobium baderi]|uniref:RNA polymerase sigma factor n=1 Tax=Sphingobium baderi TaxID=1332080 RepID=UPI002B402A44|nr:sigma-70 family RNA polymerase sigma factor [Sphingobium baderi]WRD77155.1 sigma-70 family RNA polymerase sigma factor [Sphingobium baderi]
MSGLVRFSGWFVSAFSVIQCSSLAIARLWAAMPCLESVQAMSDRVQGGRGDRNPMSVASIEALYRHESNRLIRFFARRTRHEAEAQDLMHDAFLHLSRANIEGDPLPYLFRIARNLLISRTRRDARWRRLVSDAPIDEGRAFASPPEQSLNLEAEDVKRQYQSVIDRLPEKTRRIYLMHRLGGRTYIEIAQELDLSVKAIEYHISSALKALVRGVDQA